MKYPEYRLSMEVALPSSVHTWLDQELEQRGIDSLVYTRYIISLLQREPADLDGFETEVDFFCKSKTDLKRSKGRKRLSISEEEKKKHAVKACLMSLSEEDVGIEKLVEELCVRLKNCSEAQASSSPFPDKQLIVSGTSSSESSEDSGSELRDPAERYYAAFPSLHGDSDSPNMSPGVTNVKNVWRNNPLVKPAGQDTSTSGESDEQKDPESSADGGMRGRKDDRIKLPKPKPRERKKKIPGKEKKKVPTPSNVYHSKPCKIVQPNADNHQRKGERNLSWPPGFARLDPEILHGNLVTSEVSLARSESPKRENEALCTQVESLLKGMLLPVPDKTYKDLEDVDYDCVFEQRERIKKPVKEAVDRSAGSPRDESVSPELQEQDSWYTQPIDVIFQQPGESSSKRPLYKRNSYPLFSSESKDDVAFSTSSSPAFDRSRSFSRSSQEEDDGLLDGSVLIPSWLTDELAATGFQDEESPTQEACYFSLSSSVKSDQQHDFSDDQQFTAEELKMQGYVRSPQEIWETPPNDLTGSSYEACFYDKPSLNRTWSANDDDDGKYFTPTPTCSMLGGNDGWGQQQQVQTKSERPASTESVSLVDWDYMSQFLTTADKGGFSYSSGIDGALEGGAINLDQVASSVSRHPCLTSLWQDQSLPYSMSGSENPLDEFSCGWSEQPAWQMSRTGNSLSQLWNINMQKKQKVAPWDCPSAETQGGLSSNVWLTENSDLLFSGGWDSHPTVGRENTLIPEISIELAPDDDYEALFQSLESRSRDWNKGFDRSVSMGDVPSVLWERDTKAESDPQLSQSFELVPSEHSAFEDVPRKLQHVQSEPNLAQYRQRHDDGSSQIQQSSPQEHLYFSPKTHFRPITPAAAPEQNTSKVKLQERHDLFGGHLSSKTPYQQFHGKEPNDDESFVPKFKIKSTDKYIQTGDSLEKVEQFGPQEDESSSSDERDTPKTITLGMLEDIGFDKDIASDILVKIEEEFETANADSAYETDYGVSVTDPEHVADSVKGEQFWTCTQNQKVPDCNSVSTPLTTGLLHQSADWSDWTDMKSSVQESDACPNCGKDNDSGSPEDAALWDLPGLWGTDLDSEQLCSYGGTCTSGGPSDGNYRGIWSSGNDSCVATSLYGGGDQAQSGDVEAFEGLPGIEDPGGYFRVRLVNKDKVRSGATAQEDGDVNNPQMSYGMYDLMPMPDEAVLSSELEKEWLNPDIQFLSWFPQRSGAQRKPCSFFLEGNCRRSDCKFAHDISNITCRFWEEGGCFKGPLCPFLHGYPTETTSSPEEAVANKKEPEMFDLQTEDFPSLLPPPKTTKRNRQNRSQNSTVREKTGRKPASARRTSNREAKLDIKKD